MTSENDNIIELLSSGEVIGQAIELLMSSQSMSRDAAFGLLVRDASAAHRKVREVAAAIVRESRG
jgi:AmiR/NasT family two-component response regulator